MCMMYHSGPEGHLYKENTTISNADFWTSVSVPVYMTQKWISLSKKKNEWFLYMIYRSSDVLMANTAHTELPMSIRQDGL